MSALIRCANNLMQIGLAIRVYAMEHLGRYPDTVTMLLANVDITPGVFICPASDDTPASGPTRQATLAALSSGGHLSYVYLGRGLTTAAATIDSVVAYEPLCNHRDKINVLFGDGHVGCLASSEAKRLIAKLSADERPGS